MFKEGRERKKKKWRCFFSWWWCWCKNCDGATLPKLGPFSLFLVSFFLFSALHCLNKKSSSSKRSIFELTDTSTVGDKQATNPDTTIEPRETHWKRIISHDTTSLLYVCAAENEYKQQLTNNQQRTINYRVDYGFLFSCFTFLSFKESEWVSEWVFPCLSEL